MKALYKSILWGFFCFVSITTTALATTTESDALYKIECGAVRFEDNGIVVDYTYSAPASEDSPYRIGICIGGWGGTWNDVSEIYTHEATNTSGSWTTRLSYKGWPAGIEISYYAYIVLEETEEEFRSAKKTFVNPEGNIILSDSSEYTFPTNVTSSTEWIEYRPSKGGLTTFQWSGVSHNSGFIIYNSEGHSLGVYEVYPGSTVSYSMSTTKSTYYLSLLSEPTGTIKASLDTYLEKKVTLDANGGCWTDTSRANPFTIYREYGDLGYGFNSVELADYSSSLSKPQHALVGWNTCADGTGASFAVGDSLSYDKKMEAIAGDVTLYAQWIPAPENPYILFDSCLGSFSEENAAAYQSEYQFEKADGTVIAPMAYREGSTLIGWLDTNEDWNHSEQSDLKLESFFLPGEEITSTENLSLYAQWVFNDAENRIILYDANADNTFFDRSTASREIDCLFNTTSYCSDHIDLQREGYILTGWNTASDGTGQHFDLDAEIDVWETFQPNLITTLYAEWEKIDLPENYFVFISREKLFSDGKPYLIVDRDKPFDIPVLSDDEDAPFIGWKNNGAGRGVPANTCILLPNETISFNENAYLYPVYSIPFLGGNSSRWLFVDANGGYLNADADIYLDYDMPMTWQAYDDINQYNEYAGVHLGLYARDLYRSGYTLAGLNTKADGSGTQYALGEFVPSAGLKTVLYAQWEKNDYTASIEDSQLNITLDSEIPASTSVLLAAYDENSRMLGILQGTVVSDHSIVFAVNDLLDSAELKLFLTDPHSAPIQHSRIIAIE